MIPRDYHKKIELFSDQLDSHPLPSAEENLQKHLKDCRECREIFQEMEIVQRLLAGFNPIEPPEDFEAGILKTVKEMLARKSAPRYRLGHISAGLGSAILILSLLIVFYPKFIPQNKLTVRPPDFAELGEPPAAPENRPAPSRRSVLAEKALRLKIEPFRSDQPSYTVIRNEKEWANIWRLQNAGRNISALLPEVDFSGKMVVVIISQDDKSEYIITKTEENKDEVIVVCEATSLTNKNPPLPLYQFRIVAAKPTVTFKMIRE